MNLQVARRGLRSIGAILVGVALTIPQLAGAASNAGIEEAVRQYFADIPVMIGIAQCESQFSMFDGDKALDGGSGGMIGIFQINAAMHTDRAADMGMNIYTLNGNLAYARYLYQQEGTSPWMSSFPCWGKLSPAAEATSQQDPSNTVQASAPAGLLSNLVLGVISPEVLTLQKTLNAAGYLVATNGPGSPGNETSKFGGATRAAVRKFQCDKQIACAGDEYSTGYGVVGAKTRAALALVATPMTATAVAQTESATSQPVAASGDAQTQDSEQISQLKAIIAALTQQLLELQKSKELASR